MPVHQLRRSLLCVSLLMLLPVYARAADPITLDTVHVEAAGSQASRLTGEKQRLQRVPGATNLIDPQSLDRLSTLRDALDFQPGIVVQEFFGGIDQPRLNIRGSGVQSNPVNRGVLLLQDGLPLNEADGSFIIGTVDARNSALISVRRGANAITPGASTLGGELDFQSLRGMDGGEVRVDAGSFGRQAIQAAAGWLGKDADARVSISDDRNDGYRRHSRGERRNLHANAGWRQGDFENRSYLSYTDLAFQIPTVTFKSRIESDPRGVIGDGDTAQDKLLNVHKRDPRRETLQYRLANVSSWGDEVRQQLGVYWQGTDDLFNNQTVHFVTDSRTQGMQWSLSGEHGALDYRLALAWSKADMIRDLYANNPQNGDRLQRFGHYRLAPENQDASATLGWRIDPHWRADLDLKWSHASRDASNLSTGAGLDQDWSYATPRVGLQWIPSVQQRWFANISRSHEAPTYWEILNAEVAPNNPAAASASLVALEVQKATTFELGGQGSWGGARMPMHWSVALYRSEVRDELISMTDANGIRVGTYNYAAGTTHQGLEAGIDGIFPAGAAAYFDYRLAWTYSDFRFDGGEFAGNQIAGVPRHLLSAELLYRTGKWNFGPSVRWLPQGTPTDHANTPDIYQDRYALLGFRVGYQPSPALRLYLQADNLTDERYASSYAIRNRATLAQPGFLPGVGRNLTVGMVFRF